MGNIIKALYDDLAAVVARVQPSLVIISNGKQGFGAGTIWHGDGLIITNAHVISRGKLDVMLQSGVTYPAKVLALDTDNDLAALAIDAAHLPTIELGDSRAVKAGQWVMALGHPWGVPNALTAGIVIGSGDNLPEMQPGREWIALSLRLRPGHSGGPLVDVDGKLIGINTMISGPNVGFAVPVHIVKAFLKQALGSNGGETVKSAQVAEPVV